MVKRLPAMWKTRVRSLGWEDPLEKEMATHSSIPAWKISWMEPGRLQSTGPQRVGHDWVTERLHFQAIITGNEFNQLVSEIAQSCPTLCYPMEYSPPVCSVHGIIQAGILEWVAISFSRGYSQSRDQTQVSCIAADALTSEPPGKPNQLVRRYLNLKKKKKTLSSSAHLLYQKCNYSFTYCEIIPWFPRNRSHGYFLHTAGAP